MTDPKRIAKGLYWDKAWSLVEGCSHVSPGCDHCWSRRSTHMRRNVLARYNGLTYDNGEWNGNINLQYDDLEKPLKVKKPTTWAVWNDLFHPGVDYEFQSKALLIMGNCPQHTFLILTKRPEIMNEIYRCFCLGPNGNEPLINVWLGTTVESSDYLWRIDELLKCPATIHFVSYEPALSEIDFRPYLNPCLRCDYCDESSLLRNNSTYCSHPNSRRKIDWLIMGSETGPNARPAKREWFLRTRDDCLDHEVSFFLKQINAKREHSLDGYVWNEMPEVNHGK